MNAQQLQNILTQQREYFNSGKTLPVDNRIAALKRLKNTLQNHEAEIYRALASDLGKSPTETDMCELGMVYSELTHMCRHIRKYSRRRGVRTPLAQFAARSYVLPVPRGVTLIMSPWNYPLMLSLEPLIDALAAGNTAVLKPSAYAPETSRILQNLVSEAFEPGLVSVVTGGREENQQLLEQTFDYIFFTGSASVGREVLRCAAPRLTPVSLELGGKSPCIVDETADLELAARRIVFGKFLNCGQTCVAPDYICCHASVAEPLLAALKREIIRQFGENPLENPDYGKIVNHRHYARLTGLRDGSPVFFGGAENPRTLQIAPALLYPCSWDAPVMGEEIFGPLLPVLTYRSLDQLLQRLCAQPHPLALYIFSRDREAIRRVTEQCPFGGGCVNDTVIHLATSRMGFGGVGQSGMGAYHGKTGFDAFSHYKSIVDKKLWIDLPMRYQPYRPLFRKMIRWFLR